MKKLLIILLSIISLNVSAQLIYYRGGHFYYFTGTAWTLLDTSMVRVLGINSAYTASNGLTMIGNDSQLGGTITEDKAVDGTYQFVFGSVTPLTGFAVNVQGFGGIALGTDSASLNLSQSTDSYKNIFTDNRKHPAGIEYAANYEPNEFSLITRHKLDSTVAANSGNITLGDSLLKADNTHHTFVPHSTKQSQLSFYKDANMPDGLDTLKLNGLLNATGFVGENKLYGNKLVIKVTDENYPYTTIFRLRKKNYAGVEKTVFDFENANSFKFNCMNRDATPFFYLTWADSARFYQEGYYTKIGDLVKNNYWKFWYNGKVEQIINNTPVITINTNGMVVIGNDTVPVRKPMAADTTGLTGRIGDTFIDTSLNFWKNKKNGRGGWHNYNYFIPFCFIRRKHKNKIS